jgi:hypothetical protein
MWGQFLSIFLSYSYMGTGYGLAVRKFGVGGLHHLQSICLFALSYVCTLIIKWLVGESRGV